MTEREKIKVNPEPPYPKRFIKISGRNGELTAALWVDGDRKLLTLPEGDFDNVCDWIMRLEDGDFCAVCDWVTLRATGGTDEAEED